MSKQSNQRYRKEKESRHLKREGLVNPASGTGHELKGEDKITRELPSDKSGRGL